MHDMLDNDDLRAFLEECGLENVRQDIPYKDAKSKELWDAAQQAQRIADAAMQRLRKHLRMKPAKPGRYCGCCEAWHDN